MLDFSNMTNAELTAWVTNFVTVVGASPTDFGMTATQVTGFAANNTDLKTKMDERVALDEAAHGGVVAEQSSRDTIEPICKFYSGSISKNPDVTAENKAKIGINPRQPPTHTPPATPTNLVVNGYEDGRNVLKWDKAGNKRGTQYIIEYRQGAETEFEMLDVTTETTYTQSGMTSGVPCAYRVKAKRAGESSTYSNVAVVYTT